MRKYAIPFVILVAVAGCSTGQLDQTYLAAETYRTIQIAAEGYVTSPAADPEAKARIQQIDREMLAALENMKLEAERGNDSMVTFYSNVMGGLLVQVRDILVEEGVL